MSILATITFNPDGKGRGLYTEAIPLQEIGQLQIQRATRIEYDNAGQTWRVKDMQDFNLFTSPSRHTCLEWEHRYFNQDGIYRQMMRWHERMEQAVKRLRRT